MPIRVAINGFGRIGRNVLRSAKQSGATDIDFVAVNDLTDNDMLAHLLKYDSVHGRYRGDVAVSAEGLTVRRRRTQGLRRAGSREPALAELGIDVGGIHGLFPESRPGGQTSRGRREEGHHQCTGKNEDITVVLGVNQEAYDPDAHHVISNASCTTNCLAPVVKVLLDSFGFERGLMTTVHAYTNDQALLDVRMPISGGLGRRPCR